MNPAFYILNAHFRVKYSPVNILLSPSFRKIKRPIPHKYVIRYF